MFEDRHGNLFRCNPPTTDSPASTSVWTPEPHACPDCRTMTHFFINVRGETTCAKCDGERRGAS